MMAKYDNKVVKVFDKEGNVFYADIYAGLIGVGVSPEHCRCAIYKAQMSLNDFMIKFTVAEESTEDLP